jgi:selenocysteine lyase/cysteine desulfurase
MPLNRRSWFVRALAVSSLGSAVKLRGDPPSRQTIRGNFPIARERTYLNNAYWHPLSSGARDAIQAYLHRKATGSTRYSFVPARDEVNAHFSRLINAQPSEISFVPSTVVGENLVVAGLGGMQMKGNIVTDALHYESSTYLYRSLQAQGHDVRFVLPRLGRIELADLDKVIDRNTRLVAVSLVSYLNGFQHDLTALCELAHSRGAFVYADLVQAAGAIPIDVRASHVDFCACGSHKWLMGDMGLGFLYVREDLLDRVLARVQYGSRQTTAFENHVFPYDETPDGAASWRQIPGAAGHFEVGTISDATVAALNYSLPFIQSIGAGNIQAHVQTLVSRLQKELPRLGYPSATPPDARSPIVSFVVKEPKAVAARLEQAGIDAKIDQHLLRISPSIYNDQTDIDKLLDALG